MWRVLVLAGGQRSGRLVGDVSSSVATGRIVNSPSKWGQSLGMLATALRSSFTLEPVLTKGFR